MCTCVSMVRICVWVFACVCMSVCMYYMCTVKHDILIGIWPRDNDLS